MAGIYLHVPYCKVKCHYCDFHFSTQHQSVPEMAQAMLSEITQRSSYLGKETIHTIYFGGGTPSLFSAELLGQFIERINAHFTVAANAEITVECNPDDLNAGTLKALWSIGVNRLSIGIQSFDDDVLRFMNRAHDKKEALQSVDTARKAGFENITVDLIYGVPGQEEGYWQKQLEQFRMLDVPHLSSYCLTIEPKTYFGSLHKKGKLDPAEDEAALSEFQLLVDFTRDNGFEQYEISNFAKQGFISRHNSAYWLGEKYLGIGPSAHSYNQLERSWNIANNAKYITLVNNGSGYGETEVLTKAARFNDYVLTRLRTKWGIDPSDLQFAGEEDMAGLLQKIEGYIRQGLVAKQEQVFVLTDKGKYRADGIAADLFI